MESHPALSGLIGQSASFLQVLARIQRVACFDAPVLIQGETGTGKELVARAIHYSGPRRAAPFVPVNCGALPDTLIESELFGCERGAYTDARQARLGLVAAAEGGTLFLDELDALPARAQASVLRFLQDQTYRPLGATRERAGDVRIVAAAGPRLPALLASGDFRADLAFRLDVLALALPPLRARPGDARLLAEYFMQRYARRYQLAPRPLSPAALSWLECYPWPGNVRELDNRVHRAMLLCEGDWLELCEAPTPPPADAQQPPGLSYQLARDQALARWEYDYLATLMRVCAGNVTRAAAVAGKERRALGKLLKKHGLSPACGAAPGSDSTQAGVLATQAAGRAASAGNAWGEALRSVLPRFDTAA